MEKDKIKKALSACNDFHNYSEDDIDQLVSICKYVEKKKNDTVLSVDHNGRYVFVVDYGTLSLRLKTNRYKELKEKQLFGEIGIFNEKGRLGTIKCKTNSGLVAIDKIGIFNPDILPIKLRFKLLYTFTNKIIGYFYNEFPSLTSELIAKGECESIEFKESEKSMPKIIKTIVAFMNLNGGSILIGVHDNGEVLGVALDNQELDNIQKDLYNQIRSKIGNYFAPLVNFDVEYVNDRQVIRIDIDPSKSPVFYKEYRNNEEKETFIIRTGSTNNTLVKASKIISFIQNNYKR